MKNVINFLKDSFEKDLGELFALELIKISSFSGNHLVALGGGNTPKKINASCVEYLKINGYDFSNVYFTLTDERCVPFSDNASNSRMIIESLLKPLGLEDKFLDLNREDLTSFRSDLEQISDFQLSLAFLGVGSDGHTASLYPGEKLSGDIVKIEKGHDGLERVSMSCDFLKLFKTKWFIVNSIEKMKAFENSINDSTTFQPIKEIFDSNSIAYKVKDL